jgi:RimJ/RimL family protein N-acetyltransferase
MLHRGGWTFTGGAKMLKPAQLYKEQLELKNTKTWYDTDYMYWNGSTGNHNINLPDNNYEWHCFVSVDKDENVIGFISYSINWTSVSADRFGIISFDKGNMTFVKDIYEAVCNIFEKYNINRIQWSCFADNPAIRGYRNFIKKHGGRECGYHHQIARLQDGKLHDDVEFEIMASEFRR